MDAETRTCAHCGEEFPASLSACPACGTPFDASTDTTVEPRSTGTPAADGPPAPPEVPKSLPPEVARRLSRIAQWQEAAQPLGIELPRFPTWAEAAIRRSSGSDGWQEVMRGVERLAQKSVVQALENWERQTKSRLVRLEAYSVDGRLERDQMDDVLHAARSGEVSQALATYQQVDRVVALKERHLDQAREELERLVSLFRDMEALNLAPPENPTEIAEDLERELRSGRLAALKQQLRALRNQATQRLKAGLPAYVSRYGEFLVQERAEGIAVELEAAELARGTRAFMQGHPEEALRRLRMLAQVHGSGPGTVAKGRST